MSNLLVLADRTEPRDLKLGNTILKIYRKELLRVRRVCLRGTWFEAGSVLTILPAEPDSVWWGSEVLLRTGLGLILACRINLQFILMCVFLVTNKKS
jgi:hypothetical protein